MAKDTQVRLETDDGWRPYDATENTSPAPEVAFGAEGMPCFRCGAPFPAEALMAYQGAHYCAACKRNYFQHLAQGTLEVKLTPPYAFIKRALAKVVDWNIAFFLWFALSTLLSNHSSLSSDDMIYGTSAVLVFVAYIAATAIATARFGGTPGKRMFHLRVADCRGKQLSYIRALARSLAEIASIASAGLGYLVSSSSGEKRTLHDRIAFTYVIQEEGPWPWAR